MLVNLTACEKATEPMNAISNSDPGAASTRRIEVRNKDQAATIEVPVGWIHQPRATGARLLPASHAEMRNPPQIDVQLAGERAPAGEWPQQRELGATQARYKMTPTEGGSGGDLLVLKAWIPCGSGHLLLSYSQQAEAPAQLDPALAWTVLRSAACGKT
jgi:hypothetical protein